MIGVADPPVRYWLGHHEHVLDCYEAQDGSPVRAHVAPEGQVEAGVAV